jgi:hypothetical protein
MPILDINDFFMLFSITLMFVLFFGLVILSMYFKKPIGRGRPKEYYYLFGKKIRIRYKRKKKKKHN